MEVWTQHMIPVLYLFLYTLHSSIRLHITGITWTYTQETWAFYMKIPLYNGFFQGINYMFLHVHTRWHMLVSLSCKKLTILSTVTLTLRTCSCSSCGNSIGTVCSYPSLVARPQSALHCPWSMELRSRRPTKCSLFDFTCSILAAYNKMSSWLETH